jgi:hypothetical protein
MGHISPAEADFHHPITRGHYSGTNRITPPQYDYIFRTRSNDAPSNSQRCRYPSANRIDDHETPTIFTEGYSAMAIPSSNNRTLLEHNDWELWEPSDHANTAFIYPRTDQDYIEGDITMACSPSGIDQCDPLWTSWVDNYLGDTVPGSPSQQFTLSSALVRGEKPSAALYSGSKPSVQVKGVSSKTAKPKKPKSQKKTPGLSKIPVESRRILEGYFQKNPYPPKDEIAALAQLAALKPNTVKNWFNNTRARGYLPGTSILLDLFRYQHLTNPLY